MVLTTDLFLSYDLFIGNCSFHSSPSSVDREVCTFIMTKVQV